ncbi:DoxX family protein [Neobacillus sp. 3P2-tot-E-2]|uniref:DoxX family protein n=1 Tax=Neobacillus sp. 3P2-tot-E-2 TaxID=3132212 RepID=UPI00399F5770
MLGALGLLIGFWYSQFALLASGGAVLLMAGAAFTHLNAGQGIGDTMPSIVLLILGIIVLLVREQKHQKKNKVVRDNNKTTRSDGLNCRKDINFLFELEP